MLTAMGCTLYSLNVPLKKVTWVQVTRARWSFYLWSRILVQIWTSTMLGRYQPYVQQHYPVGSNIFLIFGTQVFRPEKNFSTYLVIMLINRDFKKTWFINFVDGNRSKNKNFLIMKLPLNSFGRSFNEPRPIILLVNRLGEMKIYLISQNLAFFHNQQVKTLETWVFCMFFSF